jgi:hypothetical protein
MVDDATAPTGRPPGRTSFEQSRQQGYEPDAEERHAARRAHVLAAAGAALSCGWLLGVAGALLPYLSGSGKRPFASFHIHQSAAAQVVLTLVQLLVFGLAIGLSYAGVGWPLLPWLAVPWSAAVIYPLAVAYGAGRGHWTRYPGLGSWVLARGPLLP